LTNRFVVVALAGEPEADMPLRDTSPNLCSFLLVDTGSQSYIFGVVTTPPIVAGLDVGGTKTNATLLDSKGVFLNNRMVETPSRVLEGLKRRLKLWRRQLNSPSPVQECLGSRCG